MDKILNFGISACILAVFIQSWENTPNYSEILSGKWSVPVDVKLFMYDTVSDTVVITDDFEIPETVYYIKSDSGLIEHHYISNRFEKTERSKIIEVLEFEFTGSLTGYLSTDEYNLKTSEVFSEGDQMYFQLIPDEKLLVINRTDSLNIEVKSDSLIQIDNKELKKVFIK